MNGVLGRAKEFGCLAHADLFEIGSRCFAGFLFEAVDEGTDGKTGVIREIIDGIEATAILSSGMASCIAFVSQYGQQDKIIDLQRCDAAVTMGLF